jgi:colicin import membrane protein
LYRLEVAFQIQKNWAFNEQLAGDDQSLVAAIVFKVMPDGEIRDIFFTDRSGNTYLDESAYKAIVKSNPVDSHPPADWLNPTWSWLSGSPPRVSVNRCGAGRLFL